MSRHPRTNPYADRPTEAAILHYRVAASLGHDDARLNCGRLLLQIGRGDEAMAEWDAGAAAGVPACKWALGAAIAGGSEGWGDVGDFVNW
jgi:TPR repeat protein